MSAFKQHKIQALKAYARSLTTMPTGRSQPVNGVVPEDVDEETIDQLVQDALPEVELDENGNPRFISVAAIGGVGALVLKLAAVAGVGGLAFSSYQTYVKKNNTEGAVTGIYVDQNNQTVRYWFHSTPEVTLSVGDKVAVDGGTYLSGFFTIQQQMLEPNTFVVPVGSISHQVTHSGEVTPVPSLQVAVSTSYANQFKNYTNKTVESVLGVANTAVEGVGTVINTGVSSASEAVSTVGTTITNIALPTVYVLIAILVLVVIIKLSLSMSNSKRR